MLVLESTPDISAITNLINTWIHIGQALVGSIGALGRPVNRELRLGSMAERPPSVDPANSPLTPRQLEVAKVVAKRPWTRDWANWSLLIAALGWFAVFFSKVAPVLLLLGLIAGVVAVTRSPYRNRAITGIIINGLGLTLVIVEVVLSVSR